MIYEKIKGGISLDTNTAQQAVSHFSNSNKGFQKHIIITSVCLLYEGRRDERLAQGH